MAWSGGLGSEYRWRPEAFAVLDAIVERNQDAHSDTVDPSQPQPESQLVSLALSLVPRGAIDDAEPRRLINIHARLEV